MVAAAGPSAVVGIECQVREVGRRAMPEAAAAPSTNDNEAAEAEQPQGKTVSAAGDCERRYDTLLPPYKLPAKSRYSTLLLERQKTLGSEDLGLQVKLPAGASEEEWLAVSTIDIFNEINLLAGAVQDLCTEHTCPVMNAGSYTFAWAEDKKQAPTRLSAPKYFETLLLWVERQLSDESFLPVEPGVPFPANFRKTIRVIWKRLFRIYAHIFHAHFKELMEQEADAHLNHSFKHFIYFVKEFDLIENEELEPLKDLITLCMRQKNQNAATS